MNCGITSQTTGYVHAVSQTPANRRCRTGCRFDRPTSKTGVSMEIVRR